LQVHIAISDSKKIRRVTHIAPLQPHALAAFLPWGISRSWPYKTRRAANVRMLFQFPEGIYGYWSLIEVEGANQFGNLVMEASFVLCTAAAKGADLKI